MSLRENFNEDTRVKLPATIHFLRLGYKYRSYNKAIEKLATIIKEEPIEKIILGYPKNMNGSVGPRALETEVFKKMLEDEFNIEVELQDERLSTKEASGYMIKADVSRKKRKQKIDSLAANIILQTYLDKRKGGEYGK